MLFLYLQNEEAAGEDLDSDESEEYQPSDASGEVESEGDSDEDYSSIAEDESESGKLHPLPMMNMVSCFEINAHSCVIIDDYFNTFPVIV